MGPLLALLITFGLMWVLLILPQQRRMKAHQAVVASLEVGDEILTAGGVYGTITSVDQETLAIEVAPGVVLRVLRSAVTSRIGPDDTGIDDDVTVPEDEI
jgi:preprotein translocase subunit YajC